MTVPLSHPLSRALQWVETMKQPQGYAGPVTHYWGSSLRYTGPGTDWRYEGLVHAFLTLHSKTHDPLFLERAMECGTFMVNAQRPSGAFRNSSFEANPSFQYSGTPHEAAVDVALLELVRVLRLNHKPYQAFLDASIRNIENVQFGEFWNEKEKTFFQFQRGRTKNNDNQIVPNKVATIGEALLLAHEITGTKKYYDASLFAGQSILKHQDHDQFEGGIYQSDTHSKLIPFYTARCIPFLIRLYEKTKKETFLDAATDAAHYVKDHQLENGFFSFGENVTDSSSTAPVFIAGAGDIGRAFRAVSKYTPFSTRGIVKGLLSVQRANGSFPTKREIMIKKGELPSWKDQLGVVGWNDKALRFLSEEMKEGETIIHPPQEAFPSTVESVAEGEIFEDAHWIRVSGSTSYAWKKSRAFAQHSVLEPLLYSAAESGIPILSHLGRAGWKKKRD